METVIRVPGESSGLTVIMCNFGSGGVLLRDFSLSKEYVVCLLSF